MTRKIRLRKFIILFGCVGCGKGGAGKELRRGYDQLVIGQSDLLRFYSGYFPNSPEAHDFLRACDNGDYASDETALSTLEYFLPSFLTGHEVAFGDGMCRTLPQLQIMSSLAAKHDFALGGAFINLNQDECRTRILTFRRATEKRSDDTPERVDFRIKLYHDKTIPVIRQVREQFPDDFLEVPGILEPAEKAELIAQHFKLEKHRPATCG